MARPTACLGRALRAPGTVTVPAGRPPRPGAASPAGPTPSPRFEAGTKLATRQALNQCLNATAAGLPGPRRRRGRPDRQQRRRSSRAPAVQSREAPGRRPAPLRHPRASPWRRHERAWPLHGGVLPRRRDLLRASPTTCAPPFALPPSAELHVVYSWTHDSIGLGEDGPTHQPIEQLASLRAMPGHPHRAAGRRQPDGRSPGSTQSRRTVPLA